jgi:hypothetical protein
MPIVRALALLSNGQQWLARRIRRSRFANPTQIIEECPGVTLADASNFFFCRPSASWKICLLLMQPAPPGFFRVIATCEDGTLCDSPQQPRVKKSS